MARKMLRPDAKGRVLLGKLAFGVSGFMVTVTPDNKIILEPYTEIPLQEKWLFENEQVKQQVRQGLDDAKAGRIVKKGGFSTFIDDDIE